MMYTETLEVFKQKEILMKIFAWCFFSWAWFSLDLFIKNGENRVF